MDTPIFTSLRLQNFRSYIDYAIELNPGVNIVVGPNASGKTNLLESLLVVCGSPSFRTAYDNLINNKKSWARIDSSNNEGTRVVKLKFKNDILDKSFEINEKLKKRLSFNDVIPCVLFEPEGMRLLTGPPDLRRNFFDDILSETNFEFSSLKNHYKRALNQRNHLLKMGNKNISTQIFAWNVRLGELAGKLVEQRIKLLENLNKQIGKIYSQIAEQKTEVYIKYISDLNLKSYESSLIKALENSIEKDMLRGYTYFGPHREDYAIQINNKNADLIASRGETRTLVLSLKLLEIKILEQKRKLKPLVLLDDVFSELDGMRRRALTEYLEDYQVVITTTDADVIQKNFAQSTNRISLST